MIIQLNGFEIATGAINGVLRQCRAIKQRLPNSYAADQQQAWDYHIEGALAEMAVAKFLDLYWTGIGHVRGQADVGQMHEVRHRTTDADLCVRPKDEPEREYWLVYGKYGRYEIKGYKRGSECKVDTYRQLSNKNGEQHTFYFVPASELQTKRVA